MTILLYVKTHNITGLKYFGKTTKKDAHKYTGSGKYWKRHLAKHGNDYTTEIIATFEDEIQCRNFALEFSEQNNIVNSDMWANLQEENGTDGAPKGHIGHKFTPEQLEKISIALKIRWEDQEYRNSLIQKHKESWTDQRKEEQSKRLKGIKKPEHSKKMQGRKLNDDHPFLIGLKTEEHKNKISAALKNKPKSTEHKNKLKESIQNRTDEQWAEIKKKRRTLSKPKFEIDGIPYVSFNVASEKLGISTYKIRKLISHYYE